MASVEQTPEGWVIRFDSIEEFLEINIHYYEEKYFFKSKFDLVLQLIFTE